MQRFHSFVAALQKRQASEDEQLLEEHRQSVTNRLSKMRVPVERYEEQVTALGSLVQLCGFRRNRILAILVRLEDHRNKGMEYCSSTCFMIKLCAGHQKDLGLVVRGNRV